MPRTAPRESAPEVDTVARKTSSSAAAQRTALVLAALMSVVGAGESTDVSAQPNTQKSDVPAKKKEPMRFDDMMKQHKKLGSEVYKEREGAMNILRKNASKDMTLYLSTLKGTGDTERDNRVKELIQRGRELLVADYPVQLICDEWIDGIRFHPEEEKRTKFRAPPVFSGAEVCSTDALINYYLNVAAGRGAPNDGSPRWTNYTEAMRAYLEDCRNMALDESLAALKTPATSDALTLWLKQNPGGDRGLFYREHFSTLMKENMKKYAPMQEDFAVGSEKYRKDNRLESKMPKGPDLQFDPDDGMANPEKDDVFWRNGWNPIDVASRRFTQKTKRVLKASTI